MSERSLPPGHLSDGQLAGYIDIYRQQGIEFSAWCVPTGLVDDAALAISVLNDMRAAGNL